MNPSVKAVSCKPPGKKMYADEEESKRRCRRSTYPMYSRLGLKSTKVMEHQKDSEEEGTAKLPMKRRSRSANAILIAPEQKEIYVKEAAMTPSVKAVSCKPPGITMHADEEERKRRRRRSTYPMYSRLGLKSTKVMEHQKDSEEEGTAKLPMKRRSRSANAILIAPEQKEIYVKEAAMTPSVKAVSCKPPGITMHADEEERKRRHRRSTYPMYSRLGLKSTKVMEHQKDSEEEGTAKLPMKRRSRSANAILIAPEQKEIYVKEAAMTPSVKAVSCKPPGITMHGDEEERKRRRRRSTYPMYSRLGHKSTKVMEHQKDSEEEGTAKLPMKRRSRSANAILIAPEQKEIYVKEVAVGPSVKAVSCKPLGITMHADEEERKSRRRRSTYPIHSRLGLKSTKVMEHQMYSSDEEGTAKVPMTRRSRHDIWSATAKLIATEGKKNFIKEIAMNPSVKAVSCKPPKMRMHADEEESKRRYRSAYPVRSRLGPKCTKVMEYQIDSSDEEDTAKLPVSQRSWHDICSRAAKSMTEEEERYGKSFYKTSSRSLKRSRGMQDLRISFDSSSFKRKIKLSSAPEDLCSRIRRLRNKAANVDKSRHQDDF